MPDCLIDAGGKHPGLRRYYYRCHYGLRAGLAGADICMQDAMRVSMQIRSVFMDGL